MGVEAEGILGARYVRQSEDRGREIARAHLRAIMDDLNGVYAERAPVIRSLMLAALTREHILLLGPPGTAKSALVRDVSRALWGPVSSFSVLATKFSTLEDFYGPISIPEMKAGRYVRITEGRGWACRMFFVDEIWKASTAILNTLLRAMQERTADNGGEVPIPLEVLVGASNEYPESDALAALFDRFLLKHWVDYICDADTMRALLVAPQRTTERLRPDDLAILRSAIDEIPFGEAEASVLLAIKAKVEGAGYRPSDRTWFKVPNLVRASAVLAGRDRIIPEDWRTLADALWKEHKDRATLLDVIGATADPYGAKAEAIRDAIASALRELPEIELIRSKQMTRTAFLTKVTEVSGRVAALRDRADDLVRESSNHPSSTEALSAAQAAIEKVTACSSEAVRYREVRDGGA